MNGSVDRDISDKVYTDFKSEVANWIFDTTLNKLSGIEDFTHVDIINGCTQFIDNLYMQGTVQVLSEDYRYHQRLGLAKFVEVGNLLSNVPVIIKSTKYVSIIKFVVY